MKVYGFFVVSQEERQRVSFPDGRPPEWFDNHAAAASAVRSWQQEHEERASEDVSPGERIAVARREFIARCTVKSATASDASEAPGGVIVTFPDGEETRFSAGATKIQIVGFIEARARNEFPDPDKEQAAEAQARVVKRPAWAAELFLEDSQRPLQDIYSWSYSFPMEAISRTLNELATEGWSVVHVSEDRGLYPATIASNVSAPVTVRYLLVRDAEQGEGSS